MVEQVESLAFLPVDDVGTSADVGGFLSEAEAQLLDRARTGDERALREIYAGYQGQVRAHLHRLLGPDPDADDLVQTVFSRAFIALERFRGGSTLSTWLYRITANTTHNVLRQRFRRERVKSALHWWHSGRIGAGGRGGRLEARDEAQRILQRLEPDLRQVFVLYHYEGLTLQEISHVLGRPVSTIGDWLTRSRKRLRELAAS